LTRDKLLLLYDEDMERKEQQIENKTKPPIDSNACEKLIDGSWRMWALPSGDEFTEPGHKYFSQAHAQAGQKPVEVHVYEQQDGPYYGWLAKEDEAPSMIYAREILFNICFPYGPKIEEERGQGKTLRLMIDAL
jgi:hypothetical protein